MALSDWKVTRQLLRPTARFIKRALDLALCCLSAPFVAAFVGLFAILIKLDDPGPAFYATSVLAAGAKSLKLVEAPQHEAERRSNSFEALVYQSRRGRRMAHHSETEGPTLVSHAWARSYARPALTNYRKYGMPLPVR